MAGGIRDAALVTAMITVAFVVGLLHVPNTPSPLTASVLDLVARPRHSPTNGSLRHRPGDHQLLKQRGPYSKARFVYSILTTHNFHGTRLRKVMDTWGSQVNVGFITTDRLDPAFPKAVVLGEGDRDLGGKSLQAFEKFCEFDADFYMLIDDDAFIVAPNVERFAAREFDPRRVLYGGYTLTHTTVPFVGGGGGILVSNATMTLLCSRVKDRAASPCKWQSSRALPGDIAISMCMQSLSISATHIDGFAPFPISQMTDSSKTGWCRATWWIPPHLKCSPPYERAMTMHYVPLEEFDDLLLMTYHLFAPGSSEQSVNVRGGGPGGDG